MDGTSNELKVKLVIPTLTTCMKKRTTRNTSWVLHTENVKHPLGKKVKTDNLCLWMMTVLLGQPMIRR